MKNKTKLIIVLSIILIIFAINFIGENFLGRWFYLDNRPECYLTIEEKCMNGYDFENMYYKNPKLEQCCLKPHYMLQGIDTELLRYCKDFKEEIIDKNVTDLFKY